MTPATEGTSKPRLGTTWDILRRPRRPEAFQPLYAESQSHWGQQTRGNGTFQPRSRTFPNVPNVPKASAVQLGFESYVKHAVSTPTQPGRFNGVSGRFTGA